LIGNIQVATGSSSVEALDNCEIHKRETRQGMTRTIRKILKWMLVTVAAVSVGLLVFRSYRVFNGPELHPWHTFVPHEFDASPIYPAHFAHDWNRSYVMEPDSTPVGVVVLLHGLTDSPYSLRHVAQYYRDRGFVAIGLRLPGHGTVPAGLTDVRWEDWMAATRLAVREARRRMPAPTPLHLVGFSNGGALAMKYTLDALEDPRLTRPDRVLLLAPMIGITRFARFAGLASLPAVLPPFAKAAWLSVVPEFNPFKCNSFPVNGARQSFRLPMRCRRRFSVSHVRHNSGACRRLLPFSRSSISPLARRRS
jgi:pimeloyl-ACP methyl ester carboxylesterase